MSPERKRALLSAAHTYIIADINSSQAVIDLREAELVAYVDSLLAAEREATIERCAQVCDGVQKWGSNASIKGTAHNLALAIRDLPKDAHD